MRLFVKIRLKRWISTRTCTIVESILLFRRARLIPPQ